MSREEWFDLPWWEAEVYLDGLRQSEILQGDEKNTEQAGPANPQQEPPEKAMDLASAGLDTLARETGIQVRRAG